MYFSDDYFSYRFHDEFCNRFINIVDIYAGTYHTLPFSVYYKKDNENPRVMHFYVYTIFLIRDYGYQTKFKYHFILTDPQYSSDDYSLWGIVKVGDIIDHNKKGIVQELINKYNSTVSNHRLYIYDENYDNDDGPDTDRMVIISVIAKHKLKNMTIDQAIKMMLDQITYHQLRYDPKYLGGYTHILKYVKFQNMDYFKDERKRETSKDYTNPFLRINKNDYK